MAESELSFVPQASFFAADPRRAESAQCDRGIWWSERFQLGLKLTWFEETGEVCVIDDSGGDRDAFAVIGSGPSYECLEAILDRQSSDRPDLAWAIEQVRAIPTEPEAVAQLVHEYRARVAAEAQAFERREAASFEVVELDQLPPTEADEAERYKKADWVAITGIAVQLFEEGVSYRDVETIDQRAELELNSEDAGLMSSLFRDPVVCVPGADHYTNGRHRVAAMRAADVKRCVVNTNRGWR